jgi:hypothetical protein
MEENQTTICRFPWLSARAIHSFSGGEKSPVDDGDRLRCNGFLPPQANIQFSDGLRTVSIISPLITARSLHAP